MLYEVITYELKMYLLELFNGWMVATGEVSTPDGRVDRDALKEMVQCRLFRERTFVNG